MPPTIQTRRSQSRLTFDRGTLLLHPPPSSGAWAGLAIWDDRVEQLRAPAWRYRDLTDGLERDGVTLDNHAPAWRDLDLVPAKHIAPYPHQSAALNAWVQAGRRGLVVLPTGAGKTHVAHLALRLTGRSALVVVPTIDLLHQWYAGLLELFPNAPLGLLGGGSRDIADLTVATYDSALRVMETAGNRWALLIFDECHHLGGELYRLIAENSIAPYRLGLSATPERTDGKHHDFDWLIGPVVYRQTPAELAGGALAPYELRQITVQLSEAERLRYDAALATRDAFLREKKVFLGSLNGWSRFVQLSAASSPGRKAMLAHREARSLALATDAKIRALDLLLVEHRDDRVLVFTDDNATVYRVSSQLFLPAITHQTPVKERHAILERFRSGEYPAIVASRVLNEGVDVPEANIAIVLSGTGSVREHVQRLGRILRPRVGKQARLYEVISQGTLEENIAKRRKGEEVGTKKAQQTLAGDQATLLKEPRLSLSPVRAGESLDFDDLGK
jgi:superfamily II DNA or RNA helicase